MEAAKQEGLLLVTAGAQVVRFLPPLIITEKEIDEMTEKLERALVLFAKRKQMMLIFMSHMI